MSNLGKLEQIELASVWSHEAHDFTPWLARAENLAQLGEAIGIDLELEAQEKSVGPFRADVLCKDTDTGQWVLIENQLERTDHKHLGQLLTYAAGLQTVSIIWIAARFSDEHRAALDWLNRITADNFRFFGIEIELWQIGPSAPAPRFSLVCKPNGFTQSVGAAARSIEDAADSPMKAKQLQYWQQLSYYIASKDVALRPRAPRPQHWTTFGIGRAGFQLAAKVNAPRQRICVELYITHTQAKSAFDQLEEDKQTIEEALGCALSWERLPNRMACRIAVYKEHADFTEEGEWASQHQWLSDTLVKFDKVFRKRLAALDLNGEDSDDGVDAP